MPSKTDQLALLRENVAKLFDEPFLAVPEQVRPAVFKLHMVTAHLTGMDHALPLVSILAIWIDDWGYEPHDIATACRKMTRPDLVGTFRFGSDLTAALAIEVERLDKKRKEEREFEEGRKQK